MTPGGGSCKTGATTFPWACDCREGWVDGGCRSIPVWIPKSSDGLGIRKDVEPVENPWVDGSVVAFVYRKAGPVWFAIEPDSNVPWVCPLDPPIEDEVASEWVWGLVSEAFNAPRRGFRIRCRMSSMEMEAMLTQQVPVCRSGNKYPTTMVQSHCHCLDVEQPVRRHSPCRRANRSTTRGWTVGCPGNRRSIAMDSDWIRRRPVVAGGSRGSGTSVSTSDPTKYNQTESETKCRTAIPPDIRTSAGVSIPHRRIRDDSPGDTSTISRTKSRYTKDPPTSGDGHRVPVATPSHRRVRVPVGG